MTKASPCWRAAGSTPNRSATRHGSGARGILHLWADHLDRAVVDLRAGLPQNGFGPGPVAAPHELIVLGYLAEAHYRLGNWDLAADLAAQAVDGVIDTGQAWLGSFVHSVAVLVAAGRGEWEKADHHLAAAQRTADQLGDKPSVAYARCAAVHVASCRGDAQGVLEAAAPLLAEPEGPIHDPGVHQQWTTQHVSALIDLRRLDEAATRIAELQFRALGRGQQPQLASLARLRGELAAARQDTRAARDAFQESLAVGEGASSAHDLLLTRRAYGRFLRRRGERRKAQEQLGQAYEVADRLRAEPFRIELAQELAATGAPPESVGTADSQLTAQEQAVADLVCSGLPNRQVAESLHISVKTVTYHLSHVYAKLGVTSRTELMALRAATASDLK